MWCGLRSVEKLLRPETRLGSAERNVVVDPHHDVFHSSAKAEDDLSGWKFVLIRVSKRGEAIGKREGVFNVAGPFAARLKVAA